MSNSMYNIRYPHPDTKTTVKRGNAAFYLEKVAVKILPGHFAASRQFRKWYNGFLIADFIDTNCIRGCYVPRGYIITDIISYIQFLILVIWLTILTHVEKSSSLQNSDILMTINRLEFDIKLKSILKTKLRLQLMTSEKHLCRFQHCKIQI